MLDLNKPLNKHTIFLAIPAFNERYIKQTIDSALKEAKYPNRISFGICEHRTDEKFTDTQSYSNLKHIKIRYDAALGTGISRIMPTLLYDQEDFIFQVDAHMFFQKDWDEKIIDGYTEIYKDIKNNKIIISSRTPWWIFKNNRIYLEPIIKREEEVSVITYNFKNHYGFPEINGKFVNLEKNKNYAEQYLLSGHCIFSTANFFQDIYVDPAMMFLGEEPTFSLRASTRGYRFFAIKEHIVWHYNKQGMEDHDERVYDPGNPKLVKHYYHKQKLELERIKKIFTGEILGYWGAPSKELLEEYERNLNFNFKEFYKNIDK